MARTQSQRFIADNTSRELRDMIYGQSLASSSYQNLDDQTGTTDIYGWYGLMTLTNITDGEPDEFTKEFTAIWYSDDFGFSLTSQPTPTHCILAVDTYGNKYVQWFYDEADARRVFDYEETAYNEWNEEYGD